MKTEELGVNLPGRQSDDSVLSVPIKKRKFPLVRSPSPPPQIPSSLPEEPDLPQKIQSIATPKLLSVNVGPMEKVSGVAVTNKGYSSEDHTPVRNLSLIPGNENLVGVDLKERTFSITASVGNEIKSDLKLMSDRKSAFHRVQGNPELPLAPKGTLVSFMGEDINREGKFMLNDRYAIPEVPGNTELPLELKESFGSLRDVQNSVVKLEPHTWDLGKNCSGVDRGMLKELVSVEGQNKIQSKGNESQLKLDCTHPHANRSHWDLNTTMDTWEGSLSSEAISQGAGGSVGLDLVGMHEQKPLLHPVEMLLREPERTTVVAGKRILDESRNSFELSNMSAFPYKQLYSFHPQLNPSADFLSSFRQNLTSPSPRLNSMGESSDLSLSMNLALLADNQKMVELRSVKSEPFEEGKQLDCRNVEIGKLKMVDPKFVKAESYDGVGHEVVKRAALNNLKSVDHRVVKPEPFVDSGEKILNKTKVILNRYEIHTSTSKIHVGGVVTEEASEIVGNASTLASEYMVSDFKESTVSDTMLDATQMPVSDDMLDSTQITCSDGTDVKSSILNSVDELHLDSYADGDVAQNDEDKINISANILEENPCDTCDKELDGPYVAVGAMDAGFTRQDGDDDYEDGEVREPMVHSAIEGSCKEGEAVHVDSGDLAGREVHNSGGHGDDHVLPSSHVEGKDGMVENPGEIKNTQCSGEHDNALCIEKSDQGIRTMPSLQKSSTIEVPSAGSGKKRVSKAIRRIPKDRLGKEDGLKGPEAELGSDRAISTMQGTVTEDDQGGTVSQQGNVKGSNAVEAMLPKLKASVNNNEDIKVSNGRVNRSRIINLGHTPNGSSTGRTSFIPGRSLSLHGGRERLYDISTRGDKSHPRGSRDEKIVGGLHKFERVRNHDQPVGNSGSDYMYGRRIDNRLDALHGNQETGWDYATGFRFPRPKHAAAVSPTKFECDSFVLAPDGTFVTSVRPGRKLVNDELRPGRKLVNDELQGLRHAPSRRRSPGRREGPMPLGIQMVRRSPREINTDRCIRGGPDLVLLRHEEKLLRGLPDDMMDPLFSRPPPYERVENPFIRRGRSFSPIERRGSLHLPHIRSKSPPRDRTPSPCPWSSPRGRTPDGFDACSELSHCLSPPIFRVERIESPHQHPCFPDEMIRRHGSPPFIPRLPNDMIGIGTSREHDHPRSFIPNRRSPSGRVLRRLPRRFDMIEPRERTDADEYFGPLHSRQFHELAGDGFLDERRKGRERHGPVLSIRSYDTGDDVENFRYDVEGGPRQVRYCPEADAEFHERGNLRNFDGRIKIQPGNIHRRQRTIEVQEDNYECGGQEWDGAVFNEIVRPKRRRF